MSIRVDQFNRRKHRRYTKKLLQSGGVIQTYTIQAPPGDRRAFEKATAVFGKDKIKESSRVKQKVTGITGTEISSGLQNKGLTVDNVTDGIIVRTGLGNAPNIVKVVNIDSYIDNYGIENGQIRYVYVIPNNIITDPDRLTTELTSKNCDSYKKDDKTIFVSKSDSEPQINMSELMKNMPEAQSLQTYIALKLPKDGKIEEPFVLLDVVIDDSKPEEKKKLSEFLIQNPGYSAFDKDDKRIFEDTEVAVKNMKGIEIKDVKYDETNFNKLYESLIGTSELKLGERKINLMLPKPSDQKKKEELYNILVIVDKTIDEYYDKFTQKVEEVSLAPVIAEFKKQNGLEETPFTDKDVADMLSHIMPNDPEERLKLKQVLVQSLAEDIYVMQDKFANESTIPDSALDFKITKSKVDTFAWWVGKIPIFVIDIVGLAVRSWIRNYHKISFSTDESARKMLNRKRADAEKGIKNEFSIMSAFVGTEAQKTAAKTAIIVGVASCGWAIVGKIQQNPALAALVMGAVSATGVGGVLVGGTLIACGVAYYAVLKLKEKYNKYYEINRSLNELTILLHRIQKLIRLSVLISNTYNFDIAISEILEQLKILFSRFDEMLKADDYNGIQGMINANATPDLDMSAVITNAANNAADEIRRNDAAAANDPWYKRVATRTKELSNKALEKLKAARKSIGSFIYIMTFDEQLWYSKLNNDVIKLNIYLTTTIGEFNLVLNVLQMGYITKGLGGDNESITALTVKQEHISGSSEYMRMLIGILLNDILKLRVNVSYCTRGSAGLTKGELVCLGYQDTDGAGNIVTTYRRQLHSMIITVSEKLRDATSVYSQVPGLKDKVMKAVVIPYTEILKKLKRTPGDAALKDIRVPDEIQNALEDSMRNYFKVFGKKYESNNLVQTNTKIKEELAKKVEKFNKKIQDEIEKISKGLVQGGGASWFSSLSFTRKDPDADAKTAAAKAAAEKAAAEAKAAADAAEKAAAAANPVTGPANSATVSANTAKANGQPATVDEKIVQLADGVTEYIITEPYVTIEDTVLSKFLTDVYLFSKKEGKTTEAETKAALDKAIENAEKAPSVQAIEGQSVELKDKQDAANAAGKAEHEAELAGNGVDQTGSSGGRRLTRKRGLKKRANLRITRIKRKLYQNSKVKAKALPKVGTINTKFGNYMGSMPAGRMK
jgi:hypothetical protein